MTFLTPLVFRDDGGFPFTLTRHLICVLNHDEVVVVPIGFRTDLASVPRVLWALLPPFGRYDAAAVLHDYLYFAPARMTRADADAVLYEGMLALHVLPFTRWSIYLGVRLGGWVAWRRYRRFLAQ